MMDLRPRLATAALAPPHLCPCPCLCLCPCLCPCPCPSIKGAERVEETQRLLTAQFKKMAPALSDTDTDTEDEDEDEEEGEGG